MGCHIKNYNIGEIIDLKERGNIIPSLFWAIPVGKWTDGDLYTLWCNFTQDKGNQCKNVGLLLVKDISERPHSSLNKQLDLSSFTASISEIFPKTLYGFENNNFKAILILSGTYPQPGWCVLVDLSNRNDSEFQLKINAILNSDERINIIRQSQNTSSAYLRFREIEKVRPEIPKISDDKIDLQVIIGHIKSLLSFHNTYQNLKNFQNKVHILQKFFIKPLPIEIFNEFSAMCILRENGNREELIAKFFDFLQKYKENGPEELFSLIPVELKKLYSSYKYLNEIETNIFFENNDQWYNRISEKYAHYFTAILDSLYLIKGKIDVENIEERDRYKEKLIKWKSEKDNFLVEYRNQMNSLIEMQWHGAPEFLIALQKEFNSQASVISWDEVRMIGWKIASSLKSIEVADLVAKIGQVFEVKIDSNFSIQNSKLDGSYFSDFLHYIAEKDLNMYADKREITKKLLSELLRLSEKKIIFNFHNISAKNEEYDIETMIAKLGWKPDLKPYATSLTSFFNEDTVGILNLKEDVNGNDLRICLESYSKDIVYIITSNLEKQDEDLYPIIEENFPEFRKTTTCKWRDEISDKGFTLGSAYYIIYALGKEWKPANKNDWKDIAENLKKASKLLNDLSHLKDKGIPREKAIPEIGTVINKIMSSANIILSEMPWHFYPQIVRGEFPSILTGKAWCHNYKGEKIIRILNWEGLGDLEPSLVWNPNKRNPIMTDCRILRKIT